MEENIMGENNSELQQNKQPELDMKELEQINMRYLRLKSSLQQKRTEVEGLKAKFEDLARDAKIIDGKIAEQEKNGVSKNDKVILDLQKERKQKVEEARKIRAEGKIVEEEIIEVNLMINSVIDRLKENPDLKQHIEDCLAKRYDRQNNKKVKELNAKLKEKEQQEKKLDKVETIKKVISKHNTIKNAITGYLQARKNIKDLKEKLSKVDPTNKAEIDKIKKEIETMEAKRSKNTGILGAFFKKNKINITEKDIISLEDYLVEGNKGIDLNSTLENYSKKINENIISLDKAIGKISKNVRLYENSITSLGRVPSRVKEEQEKPEQTKQEQADSGDNVKEEKPESNGTEEKPKWWQFIKRFKQSREKKKQALLPPPATTTTDKRVDFSHSLKYDVVKDMMNSVAKEAKLKAKEQIQQQDKARQQAEQNQEQENEQEK